MKAYLINLDRSPQRLAFFEQQAADAGLTFERVAAVDGATMSSGELARQISPDYQFQPLMATEAAVFLSHRLCWQKMVDSGDSHAAIFEDDACLAPEVGTFLAAFAAAPVDADIVRLETTGRRIVLGPQLAGPLPDIALHRLLTWHGGTAGYIISRQAASDLLNRTTTLTDPVDQLLFHPHSAISQSLVILQANPGLVMQHDLAHSGATAGALASTTGRSGKPFRLWRHGPLVDIRRMWIKHRERGLRARLGKVQANSLLKVPFAGQIAREGENAKPVIEIAITGGLGNQMFQYAAGRALAISTAADLHLDIGFFDSKRHRNFELASLPISTGTVSGRGARWPKPATYIEPHFHPDPKFADLKPPLRIEGYFQSPAYFAAHADIIRTELMPPAPNDPESLRIAEAMGRQSSASLHIRRGDYVANPKIQSLFVTCPISYYVAAMQHLPVDAQVFVFSDDIAWARENLPPIRPLVFVGEDSPRAGLADLWLMTRAQHHIIANSSFSWWGAWLAGNEGIAIAPSRWFHDASVNDSGLIPAGWIRLPV